MKRAITLAAVERERERERESCSLKDNKRGITLMVLILMVVIMLILLGVGTKVIIDGKVFTQAEKSVNGTNEKIAEEQTKVDELTGELTSVIQSQCEHNWGEWENIKTVTETETGQRKRICSKCGKIEIQDVLITWAYIKGYDPSIGEKGETINTTYVSEGSATGGTYEKDKTRDGSQGNGAANQEFAVTSITLWKIIGQDEEGRILIMSDDPVGTTDNQGFKIDRQAGYLNAISELNKISSIYGQGKYADKTLYPVGNGTKKQSGGRSIRIEDVYYRPKQNTYEIKQDEEDGQEYIYVNGTKTTIENSNYSVQYFDNVEQDWKTLALGDEPVIFYENSGFSGLPGTDLYNSAGEVPYVWYASQTSESRYYSIYGGSIMGGGRMMPGGYSMLINDNYVRWSSHFVQPVVYLKSNLNYEYDSETNTYTILGYN